MLNALEVNDKDKRKMNSICSKLTIKTPERRQLILFFFVNFKHILHNIQHINLMLFFLHLHIYLRADLVQYECRLEFGDVLSNELFYKNLYGGAFLQK